LPVGILGEPFDASPTSLGCRSGYHSGASAILAEGVNGSIIVLMVALSVVHRFVQTYRLS